LPSPGAAPLNLPSAALDFFVALPLPEPESLPHAATPRDMPAASSSGRTRRTYK